MNQKRKPARVTARAVADAAAAADFDLLQHYLAGGVQPTHLANKSINAITEAVNGSPGGEKADEQTRLKVIELLVQAGCPIQHHAIFSPIYNKELSILRYLIAHGADVNEVAPFEINFASKKGESALNYAIKLGEADAVRELIAAGADVDKVAGPVYRFGYGVSHRPLWLAVNYDRVDIARLLIEAGADLNLRDPELDTTALEHAVSHGHPEFVPMLLEAGADTSKLPDSDLSLLELAEQNRIEIDKRIQEHISG